MDEKTPTFREGTVRICALKKGEVLTPECALDLAHQMILNGGKITEEQARHIVEEHQP